MPVYTMKRGRYATQRQSARRARTYRLYAAVCWMNSQAWTAAAALVGASIADAGGTVLMKGTMASWC
eukprot:16354889-Heterocapsa_arctica.AAC.1